VRPGNLYPSFPPPASGWAKIQSVPCQAMNSEVTIYIKRKGYRTKTPHVVTSYKGQDNNFICDPILIATSKVIPSIGYSVGYDDIFRVVVRNEYFLVPPNAPPGTKVPFYTPVQAAVEVGGPVDTLQVDPKRTERIIYEGD